MRYLAFTILLFLLPAPIFTANTARFGGAIYNDRSFLLIEHSIFSGHATAGKGIAQGGGAIWSVGMLTIDHSAVTGDSANTSGGGIDSESASVLTIDYSTVCDNSAPLGADLYKTGAATLLDSDVCMIDGNAPLTVKG